jgi:hypothetical protein
MGPLRGILEAEAALAHLRRFREDETAPKGIFINSLHKAENYNVKQPLVADGHYD